MFVSVPMYDTLRMALASCELLNVRESDKVHSRRPSVLYDVMPTCEEVITDMYMCARTCTVKK